MHILTYRGTVYPWHCGMVAVDQRSSYRAELHAGDVISVRSAIVELGKTSMRFVHEMQRAAKLVVADPSPWESWPPARMFAG